MSLSGSNNTKNKHLKEAVSAQPAAAWHECSADIYKLRLETEQNQLIQDSGNNRTTDRKCYPRQDVDGSELNKQTCRFAHTHTEHNRTLSIWQEKEDRKGVFH